MTADMNYAWRDAAPDPLDHPEYYDGVIVRRIFAHYIDLCVIAFLVLGVGFVIVLAGIMTLGFLFVPLAAVGFVVAIAYDALQVGAPRAATIGMRIMGLEVRSRTGRTPEPLQVLVRAILFWGLTYALNVLTFWLSLGWALFNARRRCLHDHLSGTVVIRSHKVMVLTPGTGSNAGRGW